MNITRLESLQSPSIAHIMLYMDYHSLGALCLGTRRLRDICRTYKIYERRNQGVVFFCGKRVAGLEGKRIVCLDTNPKYLYFVSSDGVFSSTWENDETFTIPVRVNALSKMLVIGVACGTRHAIFTCVTGHAYGLGEGYKGVFGDGIRAKHKFLYPTRIMENISVQNVTCYEEGTVILSSIGMVYVCGVCFAIASGVHEVVSPILSPKRIVVGLGNEYVTSIDYSAYDMLAFVTNKGSVYLCGNGARKILGCYTSNPTHVNALINQFVVRVKRENQDIFFVCDAGVVVYKWTHKTGTFNVVYFPERIIDVTGGGFAQAFFVSESHYVYSSRDPFYKRHASFVDYAFLVTPILHPPPPVIII
jgi:hypothetical protein